MLFKDNGVDSFKFLPVVPSRRLSRHCAQIAIGFGPFGVWGSKVKPEQPPTFDFKQHLLETQGECGLVLEYGSTVFAEVLWFPTRTTI